MEQTCIACWSPVRVAPEGASGEQQLYAGSANDGTNMQCMLQAVQTMEQICNACCRQCKRWNKYALHAAGSADDGTNTHCMLQAVQMMEQTS